MTMPSSDMIVVGTTPGSYQQIIPESEGGEMAATIAYGGDNSVLLRHGIPIACR